jgi:hypothetical protein
MFFQWVSTIGVNIKDVVQHIDRARSRAERCKQENPGNNVGLIPLARKQHTNQDEAILDPLVWP